jgi:methenyltetrahydrofolate cyclohydrolase
LTSLALPLLCDPPAIDAPADRSLAELLGQVASSRPSPGAGATVAWTCALAAALVEMVCAVSLRKEPQDASAAGARRERAAELQASALALAELDIAAYRDVLAVARRREEPGHAGRLREALAAAAGPPAAIVELAAEVTRLAAEAAEDARGGIRGEAITAAVLGEAVARAGVSIVELNLAASPEDPRLARVRELARAARADRDRLVGS